MPSLRPLSPAPSGRDRMSVIRGSSDVSEAGTRQVAHSGLCPWTSSSPFTRLSTLSLLPLAYSRRKKKLFYCLWALTPMKRLEKDENRNLPKMKAWHDVLRMMLNSHVFPAKFLCSLCLQPSVPAPERSLENPQLNQECRVMYIWCISRYVTQNVMTRLFTRREKNTRTIKRPEEGS